MEEKKFVTFKKEELRIREYIKNSLGKGRISAVNIEYTPVGEKILTYTSKPGLIIGRKGEKIAELTQVLKKRFKLDNPHIEIVEIPNPLLDAQLIADEIAVVLERKGSLKFKVTAYKMLQQIIKAGALGIEIVLSGKLPSDRARTWKFSHGYLKKTGDPAKIVDRAQSQSVTPLGAVGVKVSLLKPNSDLKDKILYNAEMKQKISQNLALISQETKPKKKTNKEAKE